MKPVILVIDDDPRVMRSLEIVFPGYSFLGAPNGAQGLERLEKPNEIDLVFLDVKIGDQNGIDILQKIKQLNPDMPVVMLTGFGSKDVVVQALQGRADDFIDKPYRVEDVKECLDKFLTKRRSAERHRGRTTEPIQRVVGLLERNYKKFLTLQDASDLISLSPKYLSRRFKQKTRQSFTEFRINLRMNEAKKLLTGTSFNLYQIADRVGYENAESFIKIFKKSTGYTPTEYRLQQPHLLEGRSSLKKI